MNIYIFFNLGFYYFYIDGHIFSNKFWLISLLYRYIQVKILKLKKDMPAFLLAKKFKVRLVDVGEVSWRSPSLKELTLYRYNWS